LRPGTSPPSERLLRQYSGAPNPNPNGRFGTQGIGLYAGRLVVSSEVGQCIPQEAAHMMLFGRSLIVGGDSR
jgi:hypothetical protein